MDLSPPLSPAERVAALRQIYQDATHSAELRDHEAAAITGWMLRLYAQRGVDQATITAAVSEQAARTKLAEQAHRNVAAARVSLASVEATLQPL
jgi:F0F1-type ATP synthase gamma subunit